MPKKIRIDQRLVELGLADDKKQAQALIMAGIVYADTHRIDKAGALVDAQANLLVKAKKDHPYVSRGGVKLHHALTHFSINAAGMVAADIGASTGGFTDVLLRDGAAKVYAVDVGYNELDWRLRQDNRVIVLERTNARELTATHIPDSLDIVVCDASFTRLQNVLPAAMARVKPTGKLIALVKPQFQLPKHLVTEGGIIYDPLLHQQACDDVLHWVSTQQGWHVIGIIESPILGGEGNKEFLLAAEKSFS